MLHLVYLLVIPADMTQNKALSCVFVEKVLPVLGNVGIGFNRLVSLEMNLLALVYFYSVVYEKGYSIRCFILSTCLKSQPTCPRTKPSLVSISGEKVLLFWAMWDMGKVVLSSMGMLELPGCWFLCFQLSLTGVLYLAYSQVSAC